MISSIGLDYCGEEEVNEELIELVQKNKVDFAKTFIFAEIEFNTIKFENTPLECFYFANKNSRIHLFVSKKIYLTNQQLITYA